MTYDFILCIVFRKIVFKAIKQKKKGKKRPKNVMICVGNGDCNQVYNKNKDLIIMHIHGKLSYWGQRVWVDMTDGHYTEKWEDKLERVRE